MSVTYTGLLSPAVSSRQEREVWAERPFSSPPIIAEVSQFLEDSTLWVLRDPQGYCVIKLPKLDKMALCCSFLLGLREQMGPELREVWWLFSHRGQLALTQIQVPGLGQF